MPRDMHASADELPAQGHTGVTGMAPDSRYEIRVLGAHGPALDRLVRGPASQQRRQRDGHLRPGADQAALHGLLNKVCSLGLVLISVRRLSPDDTAPHTEGRRRREEVTTAAAGNVNFSNDGQQHPGDFQRPAETKGSS